jgi:hypothetical protein
MQPPCKDYRRQSGIYAMRTIVRLRIILEHTDPPIWRAVDVPADITLKGLHAVIQEAMGWCYSHQWLFEVGRSVIEEPGVATSAASGERPGKVRIADLIERRVKRFRYVYDMGDDWRHEIRLEKTLPADPAGTYPRLVDGAGRCPPEDVGGIPGFVHLLEVMRDPKHPEHAELSDWYGDRFDPNDMNADEIRTNLSLLAPRPRPAAAQRSAPNKPDPSKNS